MNKLVKTLNKADLLREFLKSLNGVLDITNRELEVLQLLIEAQIAGGAEINRDVRKKIMAQSGVSADNLSRYIGKFKKLGIVVPSKQYIGEYVVNNALIPEIIGNRVQITIILRINEDDEK